MISFEQALNIIIKNTKKLSSVKISIEESTGYISAEDIYSKIAMPPFNKSAMDGYAVIADDIKRIPLRLKCVGNVQAGEKFKSEIKSGECVKIMTGAALPNGTDSVVMVEDTNAYDEDVEIRKSVKKWQNVCFKAEDIQRGSKVFKKSEIISISSIALLASIGRSFVRVTKKPKVAILNTGGEIVQPGEKLGRNQIYNSNGPQLSALLKSDGIEPCLLGIARDEPKELKRAIEKGLLNDIFLISGGVSMGDYDLVPGILKHMGVKKVFHKVNIKPGKPLFFGRKEKTLIFGIPGNPVSNFLTYHLFIRPVIYKMSGHTHYKPLFRKGILDEGFCQKRGRKHFILAKISKKNGDWHVSPIGSHGSADILALSRANAFMVVDKNVSWVKTKSKVEFISWREAK
jgi:molybdopterin molybdotransferase